MTWIWMLVARVTEACELTVASSNDLVFEQVSDEEEPNTELAEIISSAATALEEYAPDTDKQLLAVTARDGRRVPVNGLRDAGLLVVDRSGKLAFTVGRGMIATMLTGDLVTVVRPTVDDFVAAYRLPGFKYWGV